MSVESPPAHPAAQTATGAEAPPEREMSLPVMLVLALIVGIVAGLGAIVFKYLIAFIYNLAFYGIVTLHLDPNAYGPPSPWGPAIILVPVVGGLIVVWLVRSFAPEAKGHGVPEVMYAIYHQNGNIRGDRRGGEVAGLGDLDRHRRLGRPRGPDHPDRLVLRLDLRKGARPRARPEDHAAVGRRRRRHRRDVQHAARRRALRLGDPAAGNLLAHLPAGGRGDGDLDLRLPPRHGRRVGLHRAAAGPADADAR